MRPSRASNQGQAQAKGKKASKKPKNQANKAQRPKTKSVGAAEFRDNSKTIGMKDLLCHRVSWLTGYIMVGNGTLGATDGVYFATSDQLNVAVGNAGGGQIPILGADTRLGQAYVNDIEKHYSRKRVLRTRLRVESLNPSTANSMVVAVAPVRGAAASGDTTVTTGTTAGPSLPDTIGMEGARSCASYDRLELDLTPYIAGGSGAKQNEFSINRDGDTAGTVWGAGTVDLIGISPCGFVVSGTNSSTGLRGLVTHMVVVDTWCDYLDFLGGNSNPNPLAFTLTREEAGKLLGVVLRNYDKEARDAPFVRKLAALVGSSPLC